MAIAAPEQLNVSEVPAWGSRSVDCFEKLEQIGEGTYGYILNSLFYFYGNVYHEINSDYGTLCWLIFPS